MLFEYLEIQVIYDEKCKVPPNFAANCDKLLGITLNEMSLFCCANVYFALNTAHIHTSVIDLLNFD